MPKALINFLGYYIYFWADDGKEPVHVHVSRNQQRDATKYWITEGSVELAEDLKSVDEKDQKRILQYLRKNRAKILAKWYDTFGSAEAKRR